MTPIETGFAGMALAVLLLALRVPIAFSLLIAGFVGFAYIRGLDPAFGLLGSLPHSVWSNYDFTVAPLFILMGNLCFHSHISTQLYAAVNSWVGHIRGGLAMASVVACACFGAITGSSMACAVTIGIVALPEMKKYKYDDSMATGCVAVAGTLGSMIPPSMGMIIYAIVTENSIGKLFIAGVLPGITAVIMYIITIYIICKINPKLGPAGPRTTLPEKVRSLKGIWPVLLLFFVVMGSIYFGICSANEGAGIGAFGALIFALTRRISFKDFMASLSDTVKVGTMVMTIVVGAMTLNSFMALSRLPSEFGALVASMPVNRYVILAAILFTYLVLGCFMDAISAILLTLPIFYPLVMKLGFDPIYFGVLVTRMGEIGCITPPVGINVFAIQGVSKVPMYTIFRGVIPFFICDIFNTILLVAVPQISLFLPNLMK
jgi:C4-dicarboxylate transporter DctM subunit